MQANRILTFLFFFFCIHIYAVAYIAGARPLSYPTHHFAWTFPTLMKPSLPGSVSSQTTWPMWVPVGGDTDLGRKDISTLKAHANPNEDLETLRERVITELREPDIDETHIKTLIHTIREDGSWPGINYEDTSRTAFEHSRHLANMVNLSRAYKKTGTQYYKNPEVKEAVYAALDFWLTHDFICENWWWNQIGTPDRMVSVLLIMDEDLTEEQKAKAAPIAGRAHLGAWGARPGGDRIKIAGILGNYALFTRDGGTLQEVVDTMAEEIRFAIERGDTTDERGLQTDFSFHHRHDRVNNTLSYGLGYAQSFADWAAKVGGTSYSFPEEKIALLVDFYLDGICKMMVYGKYPDPGAKNRSISRQGALHPYSPEIPEKLLQATDYRREELEEIVKIRKGEVKPDLTSNQFYWHSEYFSHQRPHYFTSVRMYSSRNHSMEEPYNGEGLKNHHLGEGSNFISRTGEEYTDISPVWDWQKIPGTTVVQKPALPSEDEIQKQGLTGFVGAVSDGNFGAAAFDFKSPLDPLEAKKAWFLFDKEYVSLGAGIHAEAPYPVATTLNQCFLQEDVVVMQNNSTSVLDEGAHELNEISWVFHDSIAYLFPSPTAVHLENQEATGSWYSINRQADSPREEISKDVFKVWLDHGSQPQDATYAYIVVPGIDVAEVEDYNNNSPIQILSNSPEIQAVQHTGLGTTQIVFYKKGEIQLTEDIRITADNPGLVMVHTEGASVKKITVADPSRKLASMHLQVRMQVQGNGENFKATWDEEKGYSDITIDLPQHKYAGKSVVIEM